MPQGIDEFRKFFFFVKRAVSVFEACAVDRVDRDVGAQAYHLLYKMPCCIQGGNAV